MQKTIDRKTKKGQLLITNSQLGATLWRVYREVKTENQSKIFTEALNRVEINDNRITKKKAILKKQKSKKTYSRKQFGFLLHLQNKAGQKVIQLINDNMVVAI